MSQTGSGVNRWQEADLINADFQTLQYDLAGGIACKSICAKMSQVLGLFVREFSLSVWKTGNICHRAGCLLATRRRAANEYRWTGMVDVPVLQPFFLFWFVFFWWVGVQR